MPSLKHKRKLAELHGEFGAPYCRYSLLQVQMMQIFFLSSSKQKLLYALWWVACLFSRLFVSSLVFSIASISQERGTVPLWLDLMWEGCTVCKAHYTGSFAHIGCGGYPLCAEAHCFGEVAQKAIPGFSLTFCKPAFLQSFHRIIWERSQQNHMGQKNLDCSGPANIEAISPKVAVSSPYCREFF